jgi:hypothetical protein
MIPFFIFLDKNCKRSANFDLLANKYCHAVDFVYSDNTDCIDIPDGVTQFPAVSGINDLSEIELLQGKQAFDWLYKFVHLEKLHCLNLKDTATTEPTTEQKPLKPVSKPDGFKIYTKRAYNSNPLEYFPIITSHHKCDPKIPGDISKLASPLGDLTIGKVNIKDNNIYSNTINPNDDARLKSITPGKITLPICKNEFEKHKAKMICMYHEGCENENVHVKDLNCKGHLMADVEPEDDLFYSTPRVNECTGCYMHLPENETRLHCCCGDDDSEADIAFGRIGVLLVKIAT